MTRLGPDGRPAYEFYDPLDYWGADLAREVTMVRWEKRAGGLTKEHILVIDALLRLHEGTGTLPPTPKTYCQRVVPDAEVPDIRLERRRHPLLFRGVEERAPALVCAVCLEQWKLEQATRRLKSTVYNDFAIRRPVSFVRISP